MAIPLVTGATIEILTVGFFLGPMGEEEGYGLILAAFGWFVRVCWHYPANRRLPPNRWSGAGSRGHLSFDYGRAW